MYLSFFILLQASPAELNKVFPALWTSKNQEQPNFGVNHGVTSKQWWGDIVKRSFIMCGYEGDTGTLDCIAHDLYHYFTKEDCWELLPNTRNILLDLKSRGWTLGVISNFDERLYTILDTYQLKSFFDFIIASKLVKVKKPDTRIFELALKLGKVDASEAIHIGDCVSNDYLGALNAGMNALLVNNTGHSDHMYCKVNRKHVLQDISDIQKHL